MASIPVYAVWHGGPNYSGPSIPEHVERFPSKTAARDALLYRAQNGRLCVFDYVNEPLTVSDTPDVSGSEMHVFLAKPNGERNPYPDYVLTIGPCGGVRKVKA